MCDLFFSLKPSPLKIAQLFKFQYFIFATVFVAVVYEMHDGEVLKRPMVRQKHHFVKMSRNIDTF